MDCNQLSYQIKSECGTDVYDIPNVSNIEFSTLIFLASRIRGRVAKTSFDEFHRYSTKVVKEAVFGVDNDGKLKTSLKFNENNLVSPLELP